MINLPFPLFIQRGVRIQRVAPFVLVPGGCLYPEGERGPRLARGDFVWEGIISHFLNYRGVQSVNYVVHNVMSVQPDDHNRIIIALDFPGEQQALALVRCLDPAKCRVKVGKELFTRCGPGLIEKLINAGFDVFLDLKFHDIPHTVARACAAAAELGVWMINVHALGGRKMMEAAREAVQRASNPPLLIAVTILTSMDDKDVREIGLSDRVSENAGRLALLARQAGLDGVVCSPQEAAILRQSFGMDYILVTPGIRPSHSQQDDQKRIMTPSQAIHLGADYLVIGRPITASDDPAVSFQALQAEVEAALIA